MHNETTRYIIIHPLELLSLSTPHSQFSRRLARMTHTHHTPGANGRANQLRLVVAEQPRLAALGVDVRVSAEEGLVRARLLVCVGILCGTMWAKKSTTRVGY